MNVSSYHSRQVALYIYVLCVSFCLLVKAISCSNMPLIKWTKDDRPYLIAIWFAKKKGKQQEEKSLTFGHHKVVATSLIIFHTFYNTFRYPQWMLLFYINALNADRFIYGFHTYTLILPWIVNRMYRVHQHIQNMLPHNHRRDNDVSMPEQACICGIRMDRWRNRYKQMIQSKISVRIYQEIQKISGSFRMKNNVKSFFSQSPSE